MKIIDKRRIWLIAIAIALLLFIIIFLLFVFTLPQLPAKISELSLSTPTEIYSDSGELIISLANRQEVRLSQISPHFINAILAMEDTDFYKHQGLNKRGLLRALFQHLSTLRKSGGGSSITQQLAKNMFFSFDYSWSRKIKDALLACQMEQRYSKQEILEAYCNQIDLGANSFGVSRRRKPILPNTPMNSTLRKPPFWQI